MKLLVDTRVRNLQGFLYEAGTLFTSGENFTRRWVHVCHTSDFSACRGVQFVVEKWIDDAGWGFLKRRGSLKGWNLAKIGIIIKWVG